MKPVGGSPSVCAGAATRPPKLVLDDEGFVDLPDTLEELNPPAFARTVGSTDPAIIDRTISEVLTVLGAGQDLPRANAALARLHDLAPQDSTQTMLITQMLAVHELSLTYLRRASAVETVEQSERAVALAQKLTRTFAKQAEVLDKLRRGPSQQLVKVEHVHVHAGAQAIVGAVSKT